MSEDFTYETESVEEDSKAIPLHRRLTSEDIEQLKSIFKNAKLQKLEYNELRDVLASYNIIYSDEDYETMFYKINTNRDNQCDWHEFISFLILSFQDDDPYGQPETLILPISSNVVVKRTGHRYPVVGINFYLPTNMDEAFQNVGGNLLTVSKEGSINFWSRDLELIKSELPSNIKAKISPIMVLTMCSLPDVEIVCLTSTENDLQFYDVSTVSVTFRLYIINFRAPIFCIHYSCQESNFSSSKLVMGDVLGNVYLFEFNPSLRGPFQSKPGSSYVTHTWNSLKQGANKKISVREFTAIHPDTISQVGCAEGLNLILAAAEYHSKTKGKCPGLIAVTLTQPIKKSVYDIPKGVTSFAVDKINGIIITGGPDRILRYWNPIVPQKPISTLSGHNAGIIYVFVQPEEKKVYTFDHNKIIKVWSLIDPCLIQSFNKLDQILPKKVRFCCYYNKVQREFLVISSKMAMVKCCPLPRLDLTDGETHIKSVSVVLYNHLYKFIITCGVDSNILVWNPWSGEKILFIKQAHMEFILGVKVPIKITDACFDPKEQKLLTGASNGTLKIWNFNNGHCIRNLELRELSEILKMFWLEDRIIIVGKNGRITEFPDTEDDEYGDGVHWVLVDREHICCASGRNREILVTANNLGELVFWQFTSCQPYKKFNVATPRLWEKVIGAEIDTHRLEEEKKTTEDLSPGLINCLERKRLILKNPNLKADSDITIPLANNQIQEDSDTNELITLNKANNAIIKIKKVFILSKRHISGQHGIIFVALENGIVQIYSHNEYMDDFKAVHLENDFITAFISDNGNEFLITSTSFGYIKIWYIANSCVPSDEKQKTFLLDIRRKFPNLPEDWSCNIDKKPIIIKSFRAHTKEICSIDYIDKTRIIISGSIDKSVRLWSLSGNYLGTLGSPIPWKKLNFDTPPDEIDESMKYRIPPDILKVQSTTTIVSSASDETEIEENLSIKDENSEQILKGNMNAQLRRCLIGATLTEPILGKHFQVPAYTKSHCPPTLDQSLPSIPVYAHFDIHDANPIPRPTTPEILKKTKQLGFMDTINLDK